MWVVKIGGSLARDPLLPAWLDLLAQPRDYPIVIVPGGGAFADEVREHQAHWRFGDRAAHAMAVLAMAQFGHMLQALCPALACEAGVAPLRRPSSQATVWLPLEIARGSDDIEPSWDVTSDSLAAWLARTIAADRLVLVKSCCVPQRATMDALAAAGIVDRAFPGVARGAGYRVDIVGKGEIGRMQTLLGAVGEPTGD